MKKLFLLLLPLVATASLEVAAQDYVKRDGWTWSASSICAPENEDIAGLEGIYDGNINTCWHSNWHAASGTPERSNPHWVMIDRGSDNTPFYGIAYTPRQASVNNACTSYMIYLSDTDMSSTPATSVSDIVATLGNADYSGSWEGSIDEKFLNFTKASTARYILFVNVESHSSSSAACAEFNLLARKYSGGDTPGNGGYNAVRITPADGSAPHRIAIDGTNLSISMTGSAIHMSNSGITVEYAPDEVARFSMEFYDFAEGEFYSGTKRDIYDNPFDLTVTPAAGELYELSEISIAAALGDRPEPNTACTGNVVLRRGKVARRTISPAKMAEFAVENAYVISGIEETTLGEYTLTIPEGFFVDSQGCRSNPMIVEWALVAKPVEPEPVEPEPGGDQDSIEEVSADCPTLTLRRDGGNLIVGGVTDSARVTLVSTAGLTVADVPVSGHGTAIIPVSSLTKGVYLLTANHTTLKITL